MPMTNSPEQKGSRKKFTIAGCAIRASQRDGGGSKLPLTGSSSDGISLPASESTRRTAGQKAPGSDDRPSARPTARRGEPPGEAGRPGQGDAYAALVLGRLDWGRRTLMRRLHERPAAGQPRPRL